MANFTSKKKKDIQANEEKQLLLDPEGAERKKKKRNIRIAAFCAGIPVTLIAMAAVGVFIFGAIGKASLKQVSVKQPMLAAAATAELPTEEEAEIWQEGWVKYQGQIYAYNEDMMTFLFMGIDQRSETVKEVAEGTDGGQADALFLTVLNPKTKRMKVIGINRNTMTDIDVYGESGEYVSTVKSQIAIQHGFGNGMEESCEYQKKAVSNLFYQMPVHGYAAVNMSAVATINDAVGGVEVTTSPGLAGFPEEFTQGKRVRLLGEDAFWFVKYRDTDVFGSADMRLERQKQYLNGFIRAAKRAVHKDASVVIDLYQAVKPQMVTDISLDETIYLASVLNEYAFNEEDFYMLSGKTVMGEKFEEFYPDEDALFEMILDIFYEKVQ